MKLTFAFAGTRHEHVYGTVVSVHRTVVPTANATDTTPEGSVAVAWSTNTLFFGTVAPDGATIVTAGPVVSGGAVAVTPNGGEEPPVCTASPAYVAVTVRDPEVVGVYDTEHEAVVVPVPDGVQVVGPKDPGALEDHETAPGPPGLVGVPPDVSVTVAVQIVGAPTTAGVPHEAAVDVLRFVAVTCAVPDATPCRPSPPYAAVIVRLPVAAGV